MSPVTVVLQQQLAAATSAYETGCTPDTPHERHFKSAWLPKLRAAVEAFTAAGSVRNAADREHVVGAWAPLKALLHQLSQALRQRRVPLQRLSPQLAALRDTQLPLPGASGSDPNHHHYTRLASGAADQNARSSVAGSSSIAGSSTSSPVVVATLSAVLPDVELLATQTRPKKLRLLGSDGRTYTYLLKGREDLRQDERLMQVVTVVNALLQTAVTAPAGSIGGGPPLAARTYTVTPLGDRSGLIQWLEGTLSLYGVFKGWQANAVARHAALVAARQEGLAARAATGAEPSGAAAAAQQQATAPPGGGSASRGQQPAPGRGGRSREEGSGGRQQQPVAARGGRGGGRGDGRPSSGSGGGGGAGTAPIAAASPQALPPLPSPPAAAVTRPTELFLATLLPALEQAGCAGIASRRDWPADVLQRVLLQLMSQVPRQLLARELSAASSSAPSWWARTASYTRSLATASIVGYCLGLGDRHLDNLLLDTATAEVVHIDYNIAFDKGAKLRVPEVVPFRYASLLLCHAFKGYKQL